MDIAYEMSFFSIFCSGGERAARDLELLRSKDISAVVNCTDDLQNYHTGSLAYLTFNVAWWRREVGDSEAELPRFLSPLISFLEAELAAGRSVLVHCLAGAHR